jgi:hypothetical protein
VDHFRIAFRGFVGIDFDTVNQASIRLLAQRILEFIRAPIQLGEHTHFLACSIGASNDAHGCEHVEAIIPASTVAMDYAWSISTPNLSSIVKPPGFDSSLTVADSTVDLC